MADAMRLAKVTPDEPLQPLLVALADLPTELDRVHDEWLDTAVCGVRRALEEPTRHMEHATAELIASGHWLSRCMVTVAAVSLMVGGILGYALAPRQSAAGSDALALAIEQSLGSAIVKYCAQPVGQ